MFPEPPIVTMLGERVALGPERTDLLPTVRRWLDDFTLRRTQGGTPIPWTHEAMAALYAAGDGGGRRASFVIYRRADWRPLGFTAWQGIDRHNRTADFLIGIGEADCRGQGYGTETTRLMLGHAFAALGLHGVSLTVYATNLAGLRAYTRAGFREIGRRRESHLQGGRLWDTVYMECLARDFSGTDMGVGAAPDAPR